MPTCPLPNNPSLEHLRKDAKRLRQAVAAGQPEARRQVEEFHPRASAALPGFRLADAQLVTARSYGFANWARLRRHLLEIEPFVWTPPALREPASTVDVFIRLACLAYAGWHPSNAARALRMLVEEPGLARGSVHAGAAAGEVEAVRTLLDREPALVGAKGGPLGWEPLLYACYSRLEATGDGRSTLEVARLLLSRGADPNAGFLYDGSYAFTALTGAFGRGEDWANQPPHPECERLARMLLEAGADPNDAQTLYNRHFQADDAHLRLLFDHGLGQEKDGPWLRRLNDPACTPRRLLETELCAAAQHGFVDAVGPRHRRTPYQEALRAGHGAVADYLVHHGARKQDLDPLEAFALACIGGRRGEAHARLARDPALLERLGHQGRVEMLLRAVDHGQAEGVRLIVDLGVDVNGIVPGTGLDRAALHNAAGWGGLEMVKLLLELGADPDLRDPTYHARPIGWAYHNRQREVVDYLLPRASIFDAVRCDGLARVEALLRDDPSLATALDGDGDPLLFSVHPELAHAGEMVRLLVSHGADLNARDARGRTLLDRALARGWNDLADTLRAHGAGA
jgi:ankyrin repeat protein